MKRAILPALIVVALIAVPTRSDDEADLKKQVETLQETVEAHEAQIVQLRAFMAAQQAEAGRLAGSLAKAQKQGYTYAGAAVDAKETLIGGLIAYAKASSGKKPKKQD